MRTHLERLMAMASNETTFGQLAIGETFKTSLYDDMVYQKESDNSYGNRHIGNVNVSPRMRVYRAEWSDKNIIQKK